MPYPHCHSLPPSVVQDHVNKNYAEKLELERPTPSLHVAAWYWQRANHPLSYVLFCHYRSAAGATIEDFLS